MRNCGGARRHAFNALWWHGLSVLVSLTCSTTGAWCASAPRCSRSPILFTVSGSLFSVQSDNTATQIAQGFKEPHDLGWAPNCTHYAFIESGSLWIGSAGQQPVEMATPRSVTEYLWSPDGETIAAVVARPATSVNETLDPSGDLITLSPGTKGWRLLTEDGKNRLLGWSDDSTSLLIQKEVSTPCDADAPECATGDVVTLELASGLQRTVFTAEKLNGDGWSDPDFLGWEARKGVLYVESQVSPIGGIYLIAAVQLPSSKILWTFGGYGATYLGDGLIATHAREPEDYDQTGRNWSHRYEIIRGGKVVSEYAVIPSDYVESAGIISPDGKYVLWCDPEYGHPLLGLHFATAATAGAWSFGLPQGYEPIDIEWTPWNMAIVAGYYKGPQRERLLNLFTLDPEKKVARSFYQTKVVLGSGPNAELLALGGEAFGPDGRLHRGYRVVDLSHWAR